MQSDPLIEKAFAGRPLHDCLLIDAHGHIGASAGGMDLDFPFVDPSLDGVIAGMDRIGINVRGINSIAGINGDSDTGNRQVAHAMRAFPGRFFGYMTADIAYPDTIVPTLDTAYAWGLRGIKIWSGGGHPSYLPYHHENCDLVYAFADRHALPILTHTWGAELDQLEPAIRKYPNVNWLMGHSGATEEEKYIRFARDYPTVYLELCWSQAPRGLVERFAAAGILDKLVWGSDAIFMSDAHQIGRVVFAQISYEDKVKILGLNAQRALRLAS